MRCREDTRHVRRWVCTEESGCTTKDRPGTNSHSLLGSGAVAQMVNLLQQHVCMDQLIVSIPARHCAYQGTQEAATVALQLTAVSKGCAHDGSCCSLLQSTKHSRSCGFSTPQVSDGVGNMGNPYGLNWPRASASRLPVLSGDCIAFRLTSDGTLSSLRPGGSLLQPTKHLRSCRFSNLAIWATPIA